MDRRVRTLKVVVGGPEMERKSNSSWSWNALQSRPPFRKDTVPTPRDLIRLSNSFAGYAKRIRSSGIKDEKQAELYDLASRVAMKRAKQLAREKRQSTDATFQSAKLPLKV
jgi:hypothetical protein